MITITIQKFTILKGFHSNLEAQLPGQNKWLFQIVQMILMIDQFGILLVLIQSVIKKYFKKDLVAIHVIIVEKHSHLHVKDI